MPTPFRTRIAFALGALPSPRALVAMLGIASVMVLGVYAVNSHADSSPDGPARPVVVIVVADR